MRQPRGPNAKPVAGAGPQCFPAWAGNGPRLWGCAALGSRHEGRDLGPLRLIGRKATPNCLRQPYLLRYLLQGFCELEKQGEEMEGIEGAEHRVQRLVVFDYDWSLIDCNSDEAVLDLHPPLHQEMRRLRSEGMQWTQLVDRMLTLLADLGVTRSEIVSHIAAVPVQDGMLEAVRLAHSLPNARLAIVSDANHAFISAMLQRHCLEEVFSDVFTNEAWWETYAVPGTTTRGERLRVAAYHKGPPHDCPLCPVNMCKGSIMQQLIAKYRPEQVVYIGDGGGDFCPCARLTAADVIFARASAEEAAGGRSFALLGKLIQSAEENKLAARLCPWRTGHDVYEGFRELFHVNDS